MPDTPAPQTEFDTGLHNPNIIVPAQTETSAPADFSKKASKTVKEYLDAARALKLPVPTLPKHEKKPDSKQIKPVQLTPPAAKPISVPPSGTTRGKPIPKPHAPSYRPSNARIITEYIEAAIGDANYAQIVSQYILDPLHPTVSFMQLFFAGMAGIYILMSLGTLGAIGVLAMSLYNTGSVPYLFLKYYPTIGAIPIICIIFGYISLTTSYVVATSSRRAWILATSVLFLLPLMTYIALPQMVYSPSKLMLVYMRLDNSPFLPGGLSVGSLSQLFHYVLLFEMGFIILLPSKKFYTRPAQPIAKSGKIWQTILLILGILPQIAGLGFFSWCAQMSDYNFGIAQNQITYPLYRPSEDPLGRTPWTNFRTGATLAGHQDAVSVTYDVPLTSFVEESIRSPITITQVKILPEFSLISFMEEQKRDAGTMMETASVLTAKNGQSYMTLYNGELNLWYVTPKDVLIRISSSTADISELVATANGME